MDAQIATIATSLSIIIVIHSNRMERMEGGIVGLEGLCIMMAMMMVVLVVMMRKMVLLCCEHESHRRK